MKRKLSELIKPIVDFMGNKNNPTGVTAAQAGTYTRQEILAMLATKADLSALPVAYWGQAIDAVTGVTVTGTVLGMSQPIPSLLAGVGQTMVAQNIDFTALATAGNANIFIYLEAVSGTLKYAQYGTWQNESAGRMWLGTLTKPAAVWTFGETMQAVVMLGGKRLSKTRVGSAIPISTGDPTGKGVYSW